jgi:hypothetical protein
MSSNLQDSKQPAGAAMRQVMGVSFPRSGHNIIHHIFYNYYGDRFIYCDAFNNDGAHCGCRNIPCINPANTFSKNHDFGLKSGKGIPVIDTASYLVQYRTPVRSIASNFKLYQRGRQFRFNLPVLGGQGMWRRFADRQIKLWKSFVNKWAIGLQDSQIDHLDCSYQDLLDFPLETARKAIDFTSLQPVNEARLEAVLNQIAPRPLGRLKDFPFVDHGHFSELESRVQVEMELLKLPSWDSGY